MLRTIVTLCLSACLSALGLASAASPPDTPSEEVRERFKAALVEASDPSASAGDDAALNEYPLYAYLQAAHLARALSESSPGATAAAEQFLITHGDEPVALQLRRAWLDHLAERGAWTDYARLYLPGAGEACHAIHAEIRTGASHATEQRAIAQWLTPRSAPESCEPVFEWLRNRGALTAASIEARARLALDAGEPRLARWLAKSLPPPQAAPLTAWAALLEQPRAAIDQFLASPRRLIDEQALHAGWVRLARRDPDAAMDRYQALVEKLPDPPAAHSRYAEPLALALSWSRRPEALHYFSQIAPGDFVELTHEWHVRAALWAGDWARVATAIAAMPEPLREQTRWRYWAARAAEQSGARDHARQLYQTVIPTDNYYALQAAARLEQRFSPVHEPIPLNERAIDALAHNPVLIRAREWWAIGDPDQATREWRYAYGRLSESERVQAVGLASRWGWHFKSIATAAGLSLYNDYPLLYPRPFDREVTAASRLTRLPDELIYAVIRQESLYQPHAVSSAGAVGLMQLLPSTAARTARSLKWRAPSRAELREPPVNVKLGAATLRELFDEFAGETELALASYNAGPAAARRWLPPQALDADVWIENIPYNETRGYVQRVLWHSVVFSWLDERRPQDVSVLLARLGNSSGLIAGRPTVHGGAESGPE